MLALSNTDRTPPSCPQCPSHFAANPGICPVSPRDSRSRTCFVGCSERNRICGPGMSVFRQPEVVNFLVSVFMQRFCELDWRIPGALRSVEVRFCHCRGGILRPKNFFDFHKAVVVHPFVLTYQSLAQQRRKEPSSGASIASRDVRESASGHGVRLLNHSFSVAAFFVLSAAAARARVISSNHQTDPFLLCDDRGITGCLSKAISPWKRKPLSFCSRLPYIFPAG